jgi:hypothetical protein
MKDDDDDDEWWFRSNDLALGQPTQLSALFVCVCVCVFLSSWFNFRMWYCTRYVVSGHPKGDEKLTQHYPST